MNLLKNKTQKDAEMNDFVDYSKWNRFKINKQYKELKKSSKEQQNIANEFEVAEKYANIYLKYDKKLNRNILKKIGKYTTIVGSVLMLSSIAINSFEMADLVIKINFSNLTTIEGSLQELDSVFDQYRELGLKDAKANIGIALVYAGLASFLVGIVKKRSNKKNAKKRAVLEMIETEVLQTDEPYRNLVEMNQEKSK